MSNALYENLRNTAVFGGLSDATLDRLLTDAATVGVDAGGYYFQAGDTGDSLFVLEQGSVDIVRSWRGREHHLATLGVGDCFGEMALIEISPRSASVRATCACTAIEIGSGEIHRLYEADLEQFTLLQMNLGREVSRRLRKADDRLFAMQVGAAIKRGEMRPWTT